MISLEGKVAVITGASRGIGKATAELFHELGAKLVINSRTSREKLESLADRLGAVAVVADVSTGDGAKGVMEATARRFGRLDILVSNAGSIERPDGLMADPETWEANIRQNLFSHWLMIREARKLMKKGSIVAVSSVYARLGAEPVLSYTAAKAGLESSVKSLAKAFAPDIRVNAVAPSNIMTDMTKTAIEEQPGLEQWILDNTPMKRIGNPEEVVGAIAFLASDQASYITGHVLDVDGGFMLK